MSGRYANDATEFSPSAASTTGEDLTLTPAGSDRLVNAFRISVGRHGGNKALEGQVLTLIIPPSAFSLNSSQVVDAQFTREGMLPTLWGAGQLTISASGLSPAFISSTYGLAGPRTNSSALVPVSRTDTLGYKHFMSLVALFKSNGYQRLYSTEDSYRPAGKMGSRIVHVLDAVIISCDGTEYFGHFNSFSVEVSAANPFRFSYSFEYTASGIKGDYAEGHLCDGQNQDSGIIIGKQGSSIVAYKDLVNADKLVSNQAQDGFHSIYEGGVVGTPAFDTSVTKTLHFEGDSGQITSDTGGLTKYGISQKAHPGLDIAALTIEDAKAIYQKEYWTSVQGDSIVLQRSADTLFDMAVNAGSYKAIKLAQSQLSVRATGSMDKATLDAINNAGPSFSARYKQTRINFHTTLAEQDPGKYGGYLNGWLKRDNSFP